MLLGLEPQRSYARGASVCSRCGRVGQRARCHRALHGWRGLSQERGSGRRTGQGGHGGKEPVGRANSVVTASGAEGRTSGSVSQQRFPTPLPWQAEGCAAGPGWVSSWEVGGSTGGKLGAARGLYWSREPTEKKKRPRGQKWGRDRSPPPPPPAQNPTAQLDGFHALA